MFPLLGRLLNSLEVSSLLPLWVSLPTLLMIPLLTMVNRLRRNCLGLLMLVVLSVKFKVRLVCRVLDSERANCTLLAVSTAWCLVDLVRWPSWPSLA